MVCCCSRFSLCSRRTSSRSALVSSPLGLSPRFALAWRYQPRRDSELIPSSRATAVTVLSVKSTSAMASRLNSSVYRFVYLIPTWCHLRVRVQGGQVGHGGGPGWSVLGGRDQQFPRVLCPRWSVPCMPC